jgi:beta-galactosidase
MRCIFACWRELQKTRLCAALFFTALFLCGSTGTAQAADNLGRQRFNFNGGWRLHVGDAAGADAIAFDDADWKPITLPHAYNEDDAFRVDIAELPNGVSWYRKHFTLGDDVAGRLVFLEFQGVRLAGEVWVNGQKVAFSEDGVMAFGADVSAVVRPGVNVVAVRCDSSWGYKERATGSSFQWNDRNFYANYGGINKNVVLHVTDKLHQTLPLYSSLGTTGVYIYARNIDVARRTARIVAESQVKNDRATAQRVRYDVSIADMDGKVVAKMSSAPVELAAGETKTLSSSGELADAHFWSWGYGYLYAVTTTLVVDDVAVDSVTTKTGFRKTEFTNGALKLNDRTLQVHGYAQRTTNEWPALGVNVPPWLSDFSNGLMVQSNGNLVRWMHVTPSKQDVESCDRAGLLQAMPAGDSERDPDGRRWELRTKLMADAIVYNRNNPSVIFYEAGNKGISEAHMTEMATIRNVFDPHGGRAMGSREMLDSKRAEWGGEMLYINKSAGKPLWATEYSRDESLRKNVDAFTPPFHKDGDGPLHKGESAASYNRNGDSMTVETVKRWYDYWRERPGTGKRVTGGGVNIIFSDSNTHHRGAENYRRSGEVDAMRLPKDGFFAHQVMWDGWVDVEKPRTYIVGHWNYPAGTKKNVYVVSWAKDVTLLVNGKNAGKPERSSQFLFTFKDVAYEPGTLMAIGADVHGNQTTSDERVTTGDPATIKLTPHVSPIGLHADGSDVTLIDVEITDSDGRRVPTAFNPIDFFVEGPAEWRGGIAQAQDNGILAKTLPVELGINRVIIRSTTTAGPITLRATTAGLPPATVTLDARAVPSDDLSAHFPDADLKSDLSRGPTPAGDSITATRRPIDIVRAVSGGKQSPTTTPTTAPANVPELSFDDNEETSWSSAAGKLDDAWIRYEFAEPTAVSELTLRLGGWRQRSYPIRVLVDDHEVFTGTTPRSLGYVTLALKPASGKTLTIQLLGEPSDRDDFAITEITGKKLTDADAKPLKGSLRIHEVEIYGPLE